MLSLRRKKHCVIIPLNALRLARVADQSAAKDPAMVPACPYEMPEVRMAKDASEISAYRL